NGHRRLGRRHALSRLAGRAAGALRGRRQRRPSGPGYLSRPTGFRETGMKPKIFIDGEHGTTGLQIRALLADRSDIDVISVPVERRKDTAARADALNEADVAVLCLPDDAAKESVSLIAN